jgi:predicted Na+-dependent transporter
MHGKTVMLQQPLLIQLVFRQAIVHNLWSVIKPSSRVCFLPVLLCLLFRSFVVFPKL